MGKKAKHPEHENLERWLVSYADFITLLFATFVVLYALSQLDLAKFKEVSAGVRMAFQNNPLKNEGKIIEGSIDDKILPDPGNSLLEVVTPKFTEQPVLEGADTPQAVAESLRLAIEKLGEAAENAGADDGQNPGKNITVTVEKRGVVVSLSSTFFFESGSAGLTTSMRKVLDELAATLKSANKVMRIEGHTDSQPIASAVYPSNWELSAARAGTVVRYLQANHTLAKDQLVLVGYGDSRPIASNQTEAGRNKNRRVDIVLLNDPEEPQIRTELSDSDTAASHSQPTAKPAPKTTTKTAHGTHPKTAHPTAQATPHKTSAHAATNTPPLPTAHQPPSAQASAQASPQAITKASAHDTPPAPEATAASKPASTNRQGNGFSLRMPDPTPQATNKPANHH